MVNGAINQPKESAIVAPILGLSDNRPLLKGTCIGRCEAVHVIENEEACKVNK